ncbi:MAG: MBL fold metallo-hydrolase, partial [Lachnospiraceae bacterium]|nr:MBL fold metallo-hydrolase [Lachnospiraceae bacterium]
MLLVKTYEAEKIGGCITEVASENTKIIFDYGKNLDDTPQIDIEGLTHGKPMYSAVFISHYHLDHIGGIDKILKEIPIYVEETTKKIYDVICDFSSKPRITVKTFKFNEEIEIGDLKVTPYKVDHSAYNSAMFVVTDSKEKVLYTGDFRNTGYTGKKLIPTLEKIGQVDYLITEGTNIGNKSHILKNEESLVEEYAEIFKKYKQVFIMMSSSNIDRITTIQKACNKAKHTFIQDLYMAHLTSLIHNEDKKAIPNPISYQDVMVYRPLYFKKKPQEFKDKYYDTFSSKNSSNMLRKPFVMDVRQSMIDDFKFVFKGKMNILDNACLIYSMWGG